MAQFNYEDYEQLEAKRQSENTDGKSKVSYFGLKNDGDEAIVRFAYTSPKEFELMSVHVIEIDGRTRKINCLRTPYEPLDKCPLCEAGEKVYQKFFVKLLEYTTDETNKLVATAKIWERPAGFSRTLKAYFEEYGDLSNCVFKIKRHGAAGSRDTKYDIIFANPTIYKPEVYVKDFSSFANYSLSTYVVLDKTAAEMKELLTPAATETSMSTPTIEQPAAPAFTVSPTPQVQPTNNVAASASKTPATDPSLNRPRRYTY